MTGPVSTDYATVDDVAAAWRPLSDAQRTRAKHWLEVASRRVRRRWPDTDTRIAASTLDVKDVRDVVVDLVLEVLDGPPVRGARSWSEGSGSESRSVTLASDSGTDLIWLPWMVEIFEGRNVAALPVGYFPPAGRFERMGWQWPESC
jgi:hypothetical protein